MTRATRSALMLGLISLGGVVALAMIAERYGKVVRARQVGRDGRPSAVEALPDAEATHYVARLLEVRRTVYRAYATRNEAASPEDLRPALDRAFEQALLDGGLDRITYQEIDSVYRAWRQGSDEVPAAYRVELERQAAALAAVEIDGYDPLGLP
ncbi:MAG TPA: hypothetical protein VD788_02775 [Candidatus Polarisedimenticolaceae bacterium]|nr:hypothetical protein [Candidatus Polarisedimenticolaceae bacterium]